MFVRTRVATGVAAATVAVVLAAGPAIAAVPAVTPAIAPPRVTVLAHTASRAVGNGFHDKYTVITRIGGVPTAVAAAIILFVNKETRTGATPPRGQDPSNYDLSDIAAFARADKHYITFESLVFSYANGAAHPISSYAPMTFNRTTGHLLTLNEFIGSGGTQQMRLRRQAAALKALSVQTRKILKARGADPLFYLPGTTPVYANFQNFQPTFKGMQIEFGPYQVAPYAGGLPKVTVPWGALKGLLALPAPTQ